MTDLTEAQEIELEMERQDAGMEQDLYDRMAAAFDRAEKGTEMESIWAVIEPAIAISELGGLRAKLADEAQYTREIESTCNRLLTSTLNLQAERDALKAAVERTQALHVEAESNGGPLCEHCTDWAGIAVGYPCPTLRALEAPHSTAAALPGADASPETHGTPESTQKGPQ